MTSVTQFSRTHRLGRVVSLENAIAIPSAEMSSPLRELGGLIASMVGSYGDLSMGKHFSPKESDMFMRYEFTAASI